MFTALLWPSNPVSGCLFLSDPQKGPQRHMSEGAYCSAACGSWDRGQSQCPFCDRQLHACPPQRCPRSNPQNLRICYMAKGTLQMWLSILKWSDNPGGSNVITRVFISERRRQGDGGQRQGWDGSRGWSDGMAGSEGEWRDPKPRKAGSL